MGIRQRLIVITCVVALGLFLAISTHSIVDTLPQGDFDKEKNETRTQEEIDKDNHLSLVAPDIYTTTEGIKLNKKTKLAIVSESKNSVFWDSVKEGASVAVDDFNSSLGYKGSDKITLEFGSPKAGDIEDQVNLFDVVMGENPAAIGVAMIDADAFATQFDIATENGIDIVACGTGSSDKNIQVSIGVDNFNIGKECASAMSELLKDGGKVVSIYTSDTAKYDRERQKGFESELETIENVENIYSGHKNVIDEEVARVESFTCNEDVKAAENAKEDETVEVTKKTITDLIVQSLRETKEFKAIFAGDIKATKYALDALDAIEDGSADELECIADKKEKDAIIKAAAKIQIIGFLGDDTTVEGMENNKIYKAIVENPYGIGYATIIAEARAIIGEGNESSVDCGYKWITKKDLNTKEVKNLLYN